MQVSGSQAVVYSLIRNGVDLLFGYPGGAIMPTYDALFHVQDKLHHVLVRHEQGAAHAATGYARASGKVGVALATSGPGATNLITGIADALLDSVPLVCITGQVPENLLGTDAFQESDITGMTVPATKWSHQVVRAEEIPATIDKAFEVAQSGRPGPVLVDITKNAQNDMLEYEQDRPVNEIPQIGQLLSRTELARAAEMINNARRPYMLIGHGVQIAQAEKEVIELAEKADIPVGSTLHGLSGMPTRHPNFKGMLGMHGNYGPNVLTNQADVVIAVGMRFDDRVTGNLKTYLKNTEVIHIEIDNAEIDKNVKATLPLLANAKAALQGLLPLVEKGHHPEWHQRFEECYQKEYNQVINREIHPSSSKIKMAEVVHKLSEKTRGEAVMVTDVGQNQMDVARYYEFKYSHSHITSGGLGTMGFALPAGIGAQLGQPDREVVSISGDGGFQMNIQELGVIAQEDIPLKIIVLNNSWLGMVRQWQELFYEQRYSFTNITSPDFMVLAQAYGIQCSRASTHQELESGMEHMLASNKAYILEVEVEKQTNVFPMVPAGAAVDDIILSAEEA